MSNMRKLTSRIAAALLAASMIFSLAGCSEDVTSSSESISSSAVESAVESTPEPTEAPTITPTSVPTGNTGAYARTYQGDTGRHSSIQR